MYNLITRKKAYIILLLFLSLLINSSIISGAVSKGVLQHAVSVVASGGAYNLKTIARCKAIVFIHINDVNKLRISNGISNREYQTCQKFFHDTNDMLLKRSSTSRIDVNMPRNKGSFNPGTDTDAIATVKRSGDRITLKDIKKVYKNHQKLVRDYCKLGGYEPPSGKYDIDTDIMPDPKCTSSRNHTKIATWINDNGGCAYVNQESVIVEIKLGKGQKVTVSESATYMQEMRDLVKKHIKKAGLSKTPAEAQLNNSRAAKYLKRTYKLNKNLHTHNLSSTSRLDIKGLDEAIETIDIAGRGPATRVGAIKISNLHKQALQKASGRYIETMTDIAIVNGSKSGIARSAGKNIAKELTSMTASESNIMIQQMERKLGHEFTTKVVQDAKKIRMLNKNVESSGAKWMRRFGHAMMIYDGLHKVYDVYHAKDEYKPQKALEAGGSFALGTAGAWAGGAAGAAFGTLICPGPGTVVGGIFGLAWGMKGYMEGAVWGHKGGNWMATKLGVNQNAGQADINSSVNILFKGLLLKGIPRDKAEKAAKLFNSGKLKQFKKYMKGIRKNYITKTTVSEIMDKENFNNAEKIKFLNCLCNGCGSIGGYYDPGFKGAYYGPCRCAGALNSFKGPLRMDKKRFYACINNIIRARYEKNQKIFREMEKQDKAVYQKMLEMARRENARSVRKEVREVRQLMQKDETLIEAVKLFNAIKELLYKKDRSKLGSILAQKLSQKANLKVPYGKLREAVDLAELSVETRDGNLKNDPTISHLNRMYKSWSKARKELFPKIHKNINKGKIRTAKTMLKNLNANMGMNHKYPYATKDPRYIALNDNLKRMQKKYNQDYNESMKKIGIYKKEKHLKPAIKLTETLLNNWQHHPQITGDMQRSIISLKKLLALAINHDKRGDLASSKYKDYKEAIRQYKASLYHNNDSRVQRKLDEAIKKLERSKKANQSDKRNNEKTSVNNKNSKSNKTTQSSSRKRTSAPYNVGTNSTYSPNNKGDVFKSGYWKLVEVKGNTGRECDPKERYNSYYRDTISGKEGAIKITNMIRKGNKVYYSARGTWKRPPSKMYPGSIIKIPLTIKKLYEDASRYYSSMTIYVDKWDMKCGGTGGGGKFGSLRIDHKSPKFISKVIKWEVKKPSNAEKAGKKLTIRVCYSGGSICGDRGWKYYYKWLPKGLIDNTSPILNTSGIDGIVDIQKKNKIATEKQSVLKKEREEAQETTELEMISANGVVGNTLQTITIPLDRGKSKIIKIHITEGSELSAQSNGKKDGARIGEVEFYTNQQKIIPYKVESDSSFGNGYSINQIIDGNREYKYMTSGSKGWASSTKKNRDSWITFYFNNEVDIQKVVITTAPDRPYRLHSFSIIKYKKKTKGIGGISSTHSPWTGTYKYYFPKRGVTINITLNVQGNHIKGKYFTTGATNQSENISTSIIGVVNGRTAKIYPPKTDKSKSLHLNLAQDNKSISFIIDGQRVILNRTR